MATQDPMSFQHMTGTYVIQLHNRKMRSQIYDFTIGEEDSMLNACALWRNKWLDSGKIWSFLCVCLFVHSLIYESSYPPILSVIHNTGRREKARQSFCSKDGLWTSPCLEEIFSTAEWPQLSVLLLLSVYMQKSRKDTRKLATGLSKKHYKFESLCRLTIQRLKIVVLHDLGWPHTFFLKCTQDYIIQWQII